MDEAIALTSAVQEKSMPLIVPRQAWSPFFSGGAPKLTLRVLDEPVIESLTAIAVAVLPFPRWRRILV